MPESCGEVGETESVTEVHGLTTVNEAAAKKASLQPRELHWVPPLDASRAQAVYR